MPELYRVRRGRGGAGYTRPVAIPAFELPPRYELLRALGRGGQGQVLLARDRELDRRVALKLLRPSVAATRDRSRLRFHREARLTAEVQHPAIVEVLDFGALPSDELFLVYEWVPGPTLEDVLARDPPPPERWSPWIPVLAGGLDALHEAGVIHRDVKPSNVLLRDGREPVLCDLGLALDARRETIVTRTGELLGTPHSMAPEQWRGRRPGPATDQFGLAGCALRLATGRAPWEGMDVQEAHEHVLAGRPAPVEGPLPAAVAEVLRRGLAPRPEDRFPSCAAFAEELTRALGAGRPGSTTECSGVLPDSPPPRPVVTRPPPARVAAGLIAAAAVALLGLGVGATVAPAPPPAPDPRRQAIEEAMERLERAGAPFRARMSAAEEPPSPSDPVLPERDEVLGPRFPIRFRRWVDALADWTNLVAPGLPGDRRRFPGADARARFHRHAEAGVGTLLRDLGRATRLDLEALVAGRGTSDRGRLLDRRREVLAAAREAVRALLAPPGRPPHPVVHFEALVAHADEPHPSEETLDRVHASLVELSVDEPPGAGAPRLEVPFLRLRYGLLEGARSEGLLSCAARGRLLGALTEQVAAGRAPRGPARRAHWAGALFSEGVLSARRCPSLVDASAAAITVATRALPPLSDATRAVLATWGGQVRERSLQGLDLGAPELTPLQGPLEEWERRTAPRR